MPSANITYRPTNEDTRSVAGILNNFDSIAAAVNALDNANHDAAAGIVDSKLHSPNNAQARHVATATGGNVSINLGAGVSIDLVPKRNGVMVEDVADMAAAGPIIWHVDNAKYAVAGKTTQFYMIGDVKSGFPASGGFNTTIGISPFTIVGGAGTIATPLTGLISIFGTWAALADGFYVPVLQVTGAAGTGGTGFVTLANWHLWVRNV